MEDEDWQGEEGWHLAARGIELALNNRVEDAQNLLKSDPNNSIHTQAGYCFLTFMNAVMTFEEDKMSLSLVALRAMEKRCTTRVNSAQGPPFSRLTMSPSFTSFTGMKSRMQGLFSTIAESPDWPDEDHINGDEAMRLDGGPQKFGLLVPNCPPALRPNRAFWDDESTKLERQIILADCQVLAAIINFLHQDWGSYMKGGWVLRKAWKIYQKAYTQIRQIYIQKVGLNGNLMAPPPVPFQGSSVNGCAPPAGQSLNHGPSSKNNGTRKSRISHSLSVPLSLFSMVKDAPGSENGSLNSSVGSEEDAKGFSTISASTIKRLMSSVSFGFGIFHLAVSLLPPKLLNIIQFFGFEGDRQTGIQALHFSRQGSDMRGPIATLALLWFHTIVRPFFGLDGLNVKSGAEAAQRLIDASKPEFANSALFLFFQGRVARLKSNFSDALNSYERALSVSAQREIQLLCLHEVGWSYLLLLQWEQSSQAFLQLKHDSRWSKSFYCYLSAVCLGASGDAEQCLELAKETPKLARKTGNQQLERFLLRRANRMISDQVDENYSRLLGYELLYLWNTLGACLKHSHISIQMDCENIYVPALEGVRQLILGSIYSNSGLVLEAKQSYGKAIKQGGEEEGGDIHAAAFAAYELGLLLCRTPETRGEGRHYLEFARDNYHNYDFEHRLSVRIQAALRYYSDNVKERRAQEIISS
eukprot:snap_masked-scaffold708_size108518-processed-gene-0.10 protein:Tk11260 transcript:snap_masked-scaffold708_size108518-processed-gene-0.10-mRNA-1 annotation:"tetratricopeptide repeat protein 39c"